MKKSASKAINKSISHHRTQNVAVRLRTPLASEIRRAASSAVRKAKLKSNAAVLRNIASDPDTFEADPRRLVVVRPKDVDVARIRLGLGLTQAAFAAATGIPHRVVSDWEQGRKQPSAAARALLLLVREFGAKALACLAQRAA